MVLGRLFSPMACEQTILINVNTVNTVVVVVLFCFSKDSAHSCGDRRKSKSDACRVIPGGSVALP